MQFCSISKEIIPMLDLIIVYGTNAAISFHPCRFLIPLPALCGFHYRRTSLALSLNSSLWLPASIPGEDHCSFFPFILRERHLENRLCLCLFPSHPIIVMFIQPSILSTASLPSFSPYSCSAPPGAPSICKMSQLLNTRLLSATHLSFVSIFFQLCSLPASCRHFKPLVHDVNGIKQSSLRCIECCNMSHPPIIFPLK